MVSERVAVVATGDAPKCDDQSTKLNCGCCGEIRLTCSRLAGHRGTIHLDTEVAEYEGYTVAWWPKDREDITEAVRCLSI